MFDLPLVSSFIFLIPIGVLFWKARFLFVREMFRHVCFFVGVLALHICRTRQACVQNLMEDQQAFWVSMSGFFLVQAHVGIWIKDTIKRSNYELATDAVLLSLVVFTLPEKRQTAYFFMMMIHLLVFLGLRRHQLKPGRLIPHEPASHCNPPVARVWLLVQLYCFSLAGVALWLSWDVDGELDQTQRSWLLGVAQLLTGVTCIVNSMLIPAKPTTTTPIQRDTNLNHGSD